MVELTVDAHWTQWFGSVRFGRFAAHRVDNRDRTTDDPWYFPSLVPAWSIWMYRTIQVYDEKRRKTLPSAKSISLRTVVCFQRLLWSRFDANARIFRCVLEWGHRRMVAARTLSMIEAGKNDRWYRTRPTSATGLRRSSRCPPGTAVPHLMIEPEIEVLIEYDEDHLHTSEPAPLVHRVKWLPTFQ